MWGLEYALLFGWDKLELDRGRTRCAFPFSSRELAELHLANWTETLCRWKGLNAAPPTITNGRNCKFEAGGFELELYPRPIEFHIPLKTNAFLDLPHNFWRRDFWKRQPTAKEKGWDFFAQ